MAKMRYYLRKPPQRLEDRGPIFMSLLAIKSHCMRDMIKIQNAQLPKGAIIKCEIKRSKLSEQTLMGG